MKEAAVSFTIKVLFVKRHYTSEYTVDIYVHLLVVTKNIKGQKLVKLSIFTASPRTFLSNTDIFFLPSFLPVFLSFL